jgi:hypothetical protein
VVRISAVYLFVLLLGFPAAAQLHWLPEHIRPDPFGGIVPADRTSASGQLRTGRIEMAGARDGYVSCHIIAPASDTLSLEAHIAHLQADLFEEWFHFLPSGKSYYPDALIPYSGASSTAMNNVAGQRVKAFWLDIFIPKTAAPGLHEGKVLLKTRTGAFELPVRITVLRAVVPEADVVVPDGNSYGSSWLAAQYPQSSKAPGFYESDTFFRLIHAHHRIFYEHRSTFHQLGYGHGGKVSPEFAPVLGGSGKTKRITNWSTYDRHYGPLLDGSAFANTRRGPKPIPFVYLPINPEWPASFLWWGEKGYETEFVNVVRQMERHFREKGWTGTRFELFFNHKKRYKAFPWDGDETRFAEDNRYFVEYARLMKKAIPSDSPVRWVFRTDASWTMAGQFKDLAGVIDFWVCSAGMLSLYDWAPPMLTARGDILWTYGGPPAVDKPSSGITAPLLKTWLFGATGFVHWLVVAPGLDPWFAFDGGSTALVYSGDGFGLNQPIPSIRLKLQRNCIQDLNLLDAAKTRVPLSTLKANVATRFNGVPPDQWWTRNSPLLQTAPLEWTNADIGDALEAHDKNTASPDALAWQRVREYLSTLISGEP